ncbi:DUF2690 domain-containing protein [Streptomyces cinerochromogenes]|uniref:DUF2690 domain-containing protein n=1 Tax=Streptomyces cinerochromogenes TaxID=66422 RepID=UPI0036C67A95
MPRNRPSGPGAGYRPACGWPVSSPSRPRWPPAGPRSRPPAGMTPPAGHPAPRKRRRLARRPVWTHRLRGRLHRLDPRDTGCSGDAWTSALVRVDGAYVELRYSDACRAAWARISWGGPDDVAEVVPAHGRHMRERVHYDTDVYTAMVPASDPDDVKACTQPRSGRHGCTTPGGRPHLLEPPEPPLTGSPAGSPRPSAPRTHSPGAGE